MNREIELMVASPPERDDLIVQFFKKDGGQWAELFREGCDLKIEFYENVSGKPWKFSVDEVLECLRLAKDELLKRNV